MALRNILAPRQQVTNAAGSPLAGGKVFLFEPGTTTFVSSFQDSGLVTPHTNPVRLSGSGRQNIWITRDVDMFITDRNSGDVVPTNIVVTELRANPDQLGQDEAGGLVPNGSFENDTDANDVPDGWTEVADPGSSNGLDTTQSTDGGQSFRFTSSGTGGGSLTTTDFFPVNDSENLRVNVDLRSTIATVRNIIRVEWYDVSQVLISNSDPYDSTANPLTFTSQQLSVAPPTGSRFAKLRLIGCDPSVAVAGSTFYDRVQVFYPAIVTGVFDNLLLADNDIESTNTNGDINITPNGTGDTNVKNLTTPDQAQLLNGLQAGFAGEVTFDVPAANRPRIRGNIVTATPPTTEAITARLDFADSDGSDPLGAIGYIGSNTLRVRNSMHGGPVVVESEDSGGTNRTLIEATPGSSTDIYGSSDLTLRVLGNGQVFLRGDENNDLDARLYAIERLDGTRRAFIGHPSTANLEIRNEVHGGQVVLSGESNAGTLRTLIQADPDEAVELFHAGEQCFETRNGGIRVIQSAGSDPVLAFMDSSLVRRAFINVSLTSMFIRSEVHGAQVEIEAEDTGGTVRNLFVGNPDGNAQLFQAGTAVARTNTAANGGFEVNNTNTGAGFERVLTESDLTVVVSQSKPATTTRTNTTTPLDDPDLDALAIAANTNYGFLAVLSITGPAAADFRFQIDGASLNEFNVAFQSRNSTGVLESGRIDANTNQDITVAGLADPTVLVLQGSIRASAATSISLQWAQAALNGIGTELRMSSYWEVGTR